MVPKVWFIAFREMLDIPVEKAGGEEKAESKEVLSAARAKEFEMGRNDDMSRQWREVAEVR